MDRSVFDLSGRVVVITGANGNLGSACARVLWAEGARLVLTDRSEDKLRASFGSWAERDGGDRCLLAAPVDLGRPEEAKRLVSLALAKFERVDGLVNTVGTFRGGTNTGDTPESEWDALIDVNVRIALRMCRAVLPAMAGQGRGSIVNVSSRAAVASGAGIGAYAATKAAVMRMTESIALEYARHGVTANCVLPDTLDTPENRRAMPNADPKGWLSPMSVAGAIALLLTDAAHDVRGAGLPLSVLG